MEASKAAAGCAGLGADRSHTCLPTSWWLLPSGQKHPPGLPLRTLLCTSLALFGAISRGEGSHGDLQIGKLFWAPWQVINGKSFKVTYRPLPLKNCELSLGFAGDRLLSWFLGLHMALAFWMDEP